MQKVDDDINREQIKNAIDSYYDFWFSLNALYENWAKKRGLTANALFTLYTIHRFPAACTQHLICEKLQLPKQTVNAILDTFEKSGYVVKEVLKTDRRNKRLLLTANGEKYAGKLLDELYSFEFNAFSAMHTKQREEFLQSNHVFLTQLKQTLNEDELPVKK